MNIHDRIASQLPAWRERVTRLKRDYGALKVGEVTVDQIMVESAVYKSRSVISPMSILWKVSGCADIRFQK